MQNPFRYFNSSPEVIRLTVMMYIRYPLTRQRIHILKPEEYIIDCPGRGIRRRRFHSSDCLLSALTRP
jgi:hypothetical protein